MRNLKLLLEKRNALIDQILTMDYYALKRIFSNNHSSGIYRRRLLDGFEKITINIYNNITIFMNQTDAKFLNIFLRLVLFKLSIPFVNNICVLLEVEVNPKNIKSVKAVIEIVFGNLSFL